MFLATLIWGLGFVGTRWTFQVYSPVWSNALRFLFAAILVSPYLFYSWRKVRWLPTMGASLLLFLALHSQTVGIFQTTLAKSGFLTVFYAIFTPCLCVLFFRQKLATGFWLLLLLAMVGVALLCELSLDGFNRGDAYILLSALFFSFHILWVDHFSKQISPLSFNFWQCFFIAIFASSLALFSEGTVSLEPLLDLRLLLQPSALLGFLIVSLFSSIFAFTIQIVAQRRIKPHVVSMFFLLESVFAALFGYIFFQEKLSLLAQSGAVTVVLAVAALPFVTQKKSKEKTPSF